MNDADAALRWERREEFAEKVKAAGEKDVTDEELEDIPVPSEEELKAQASKLSQEEIIANLQLIRDLLQDDEEEVSDEERKLLTKAHDKMADIINNQNQASIIDLAELHLCTSPDVELARMCWGRPCGQNIGRRARSLTPKGMKEGYQRRGSSQAAEYTLGKYSFKYRPKNLKEAKRKVKKANTSRARWAAASLILAIPSLIPGVKNPAYKKLKQRSDEKRTAKRQYHSLKLTKTGKAPASEPVKASLAPRMSLWPSNNPADLI